MAEAMATPVAVAMAMAKPPAAGQFFVIFWRKKLFCYHWITFRTYSEPFESTRFLTFESQLNKLSCSVLLLLAI